MLERIVKFIVKLSDVISTVITGALAITVFLQIFSRTILNSSLSWTTEIATFMLAWMTFFAAVSALYRYKHIGIDIVVTKLKGPWDKLARITSNLFILFFVMSLIFYGIPMVIDTFGTYAISVQLSKGVIYSVLPLTSLFMAVIILNDINKDLYVLFKSYRNGG